MAIVGIDEVGRGCWAGPLLVVAARAKTPLPAGLADSKALSKKRRQELMIRITKSCDIGEGWVEPGEIDTLGLTDAMRLGVARALGAISAEYDETIVIDGTINYCTSDYSNVACVVKADASHPIVSAASIYAKVMRDNYMVELAQTYPEYLFDRHVGYGTKAHLAALKQFGVCSIHRASYKPVQAFL